MPDWPEAAVEPKDPLPWFIVPNALVLDAAGGKGPGRGKPRKAGTDSALCRYSDCHLPFRWGIL